VKRTSEEGVLIPTQANGSSLLVYTLKAPCCRFGVGKTWFERGPVSGALNDSNGHWLATTYQQLLTAGVKEAQQLPTFGLAVVWGRRMVHGHNGSCCTVDFQLLSPEPDNNINNNN